MASAFKVVDVIKKFTGDSEEDLEQWLDRLTVAVEITTQESDKAKIHQTSAKIMPLVLTGSAYATWQQVKDKSDFDQITNDLRRVFGKSLTTAWRELKALRLLPGDSIDVLASEAKTLLRIISKGKDVPDEIIALTIVDALPQRIADEVRMRHGENMELSPVIQSAKSLWANYSEGPHNRPTETALAAPGKFIDSTRRNRGGEKNGELNTVSRRASRCQGCHRIGHVRSECQTRCYKCQELGHIQSECPQQQQHSSGNDNARVVVPARAALAEDH